MRCLAIVQPYGPDSLEGLDALLALFDSAKTTENVQLPNGGWITIIAVNLSGGDITHAVPDNTGYITEGQLFLRNDSDYARSSSTCLFPLRTKQLVIGKKTREDHPQMNACVRLYADAANAKTKLENGFDLSTTTSAR